MDEVDKTINDIIEGIPDYCKGNQLKTFTYIYVKLAHLIEYDEYAEKIVNMHLGGYDRERAEECIIAPACSIGCILRGKALCSGYAKVLNTILNKVGINTITIISEGKHQWNQVEIDGVWYNCDLTNDRDYIVDGLKCPHFLTSNEDDCNYKLRYPTSEFNECSNTLGEDLQEELLKETMNYIEKERKIKEQEQKEIEEEKEQPNFIKRIINKFFNKGVKNI